MDIYKLTFTILELEVFSYLSIRVGEELSQRELAQILKVCPTAIANTVKLLEEKFPGTTIILFGSYARGEDIHSSDIDIAIIGGKDKFLNLEPLENLLKRKININFYSSWKDIHKHLKNNILNGIILTGSVEL